MHIIAAMSLIGTLADIQIADVLRLFATGRKNGLLTVTDGGKQALLRFQKGAIIHAVVGRLTGEDAVVDVFGWKQGQLTFAPEERSVTPNVERDVESLIADGLRLGETRHRMHELIPTDRVVFQLGLGPADPTARYAVGATEWRVLRLLDGVQDVSEVIEASELPRADVHRVLFEMAELGFLEKIDVLRSFRVQSRGLFAKDAAELDEAVDEDWRRIHRFASGVLRVEIRTPSGRTAPMSVVFRAGLMRDVQLSRNVVADLGLREGDEVTIRPIA
jgi:hypothetical protein